MHLHVTLFQARHHFFNRSLTHYHTVPHFDAIKIYISVENIVRQGEIACNKQFLLFS